jgi:hypothetical protein
MTTENCLTKGCEKERGTRGLCTSCYSTARIMIKNGLATEKQFIDKGMMLPKSEKSGSLFKRQFLGQ